MSNGMKMNVLDMMGGAARSSRLQVGAGPQRFAAARSAARRRAAPTMACHARQEDLVVARPEGLYCPPGDFYIDPWRPVARAVITHAHSDHARIGHAHYLAHTDSEGTLRTRLGRHRPADAALRRSHRAPRRARVAAPGRPRAGLGAGAARTRRRVWVASGDYKTEPDGTCAPFEPVPCDTFITESTFGLPIYRWPTQAVLFAEIDAWWRAMRRPAAPSVLFCYAFGKAQRILHGVDPSSGRSSCTARSSRSTRSTARPAWRCRETLARHRSGVDDRSAAEARPGAGAALRAGHAVDEALRQLRRCLRQRLDAAARHAPPARRGPRLRHVRPRRLARPAAGHAGTGAERVFVTHGSVQVMVRWLTRERARGAGLQDRVRRRGRPGLRPLPGEGRGRGQAAPMRDAASPHPGLPPEGEGAKT
jgi:putative mRNA 3-end processing factor